jgi:hypothetical protein
MYSSKNDSLSNKTIFLVHSLLFTLTFAHVTNCPSAMVQEATAIPSKPNLNLRVVKAKSITVQNPITGTSTIFADKTS